MEVDAPASGHGRAWGIADRAAIVLTFVSAVVAGIGVAWDWFGQASWTARGLFIAGFAGMLLCGAWAAYRWRARRLADEKRAALIQVKQQVKDAQNELSAFLFARAVEGTDEDLPLDSSDLDKELWARQVRADRQYERATVAEYYRSHRPRVADALIAANEIRYVVPHERLQALRAATVPDLWGVSDVLSRTYIRLAKQEPWEGETTWG